MKKVLLVLAIALFGFTANAQTIDGKSFDSLDQEFVQIVGMAKLMSNKVKITINFGQENKIFSGKDDGTIYNKEGKKMVFNTMIDALNFMHSVGYEYEDSYALTVGNQNVLHYLLRKVRN